MRTMSPDSDSNGWAEASVGFIWKSNNNNGCNWDDTFGGLSSSPDAYAAIERGWNNNAFYKQNFGSTGMMIFVK